MKNTIKELYMFLSAASMILMVQITGLLSTGIISATIVSVIGFILMLIMFSGVIIIKKEIENFYEKMFQLGRLFAIFAIFPLTTINSVNFTNAFIISESILFLTYTVIYLYRRLTIKSPTIKNLENS